MNESLEKLRDPGRFEKYNIKRNRMRYYHNVGCTAQYEVINLPNEAVSRALLYTAFRKTIEQHPAMCCTIVDEDKQNPFFARLPSINLDKVVEFNPEFNSDRDWLNMLGEGHDSPFSNLPKAPLWKAMVAQNGQSNRFTIMFFIHHAIADGGSARAFHTTFTHALEKAIGEEASDDPIVITPKLEMLLPAEEVIDLPLSFTYVAKSVYKAFIKSSTDEGLYTGNPITTENHKTQLDAVIFSQETVKALLDLCRGQKVTINALLAVVIARKFAEAFAEYSRFSCTDAMSLRRFAGTDSDAMVNYVSSLEHKFSTEIRAGYIPCSGDFSWDSVKTVRQEIEAGTASSKDLKIALLKFLSDYEDFFRNQVGKRRENSFEISNIGVLRGEKANHVRISRITFSQSANVTGAPCSFSVATAQDGELSICLSWQKDVVSEEKIRQIASSVRAELLALAKTPALSMGTS